jgi:hypothetical protein
LPRALHKFNFPKLKRNRSRKLLKIPAKIESLESNNEG